MSLVPVFTASNSPHAVIIRNMLQDAGIDADLRTDDANGALPILDSSSGVAVLVDESRLGDAEALLEQFKQGTLAVEEDGEG